MIQVGGGSTSSGDEDSGAVLRRIAPASVLRLSALLYASLYVVGLVAVAILWWMSSSTGIRGNVESLIGDLFYAGDFRFKGSQLFRAAALGGALVVGLGTGFNVLMAVLYNVLSDAVGGVRIEISSRPRAAVRREQLSSQATLSSQAKLSSQATLTGQAAPARRAAVAQKGRLVGAQTRRFTQKAKSNTPTVAAPPVSMARHKGAGRQRPANPGSSDG